MTKHKIVVLFCAIWLLTPPLLADAPLKQKTDERKIEKDREAAITEAVVSIDPSLIQKQQVEILEPSDDAIAAEVKTLRKERKEQFKHLTWDHINRMINVDTVKAKHQFIEYHDKTLRDVVTRAVDVSVPADIAKERMTLAKFRIAKAVRDFLPEASLDADVKEGSLSAPAFTSDHWRMKFRIPVFRGGVLWNSLFLEMANLETAKREYDQAVSDLIADVSEGYFEYERAQNVMRDQETLMKKAEEQKKISDQKYEAKIISEIEKLNSDSLYSQAKYDLETAQQEVEIAKLELLKYLNLQQDDPIAVTSLYRLEDFKVESLKKGSVITGKSESDLNHLIELAYQNRSDLQVEASKLKATQYAYRVVLGQRLPQFDMLVEFGELAEAFIVDTEDPNHQHEFRFGMEMTWPLLGNTLKYTYDHDQRAPSVTQFQGGTGTRTRSNAFSAQLLDDMGQFSTMIDAKIDNLEQIVELEKTERDVIREVKEAYFNFNKALIQVESSHTRMGYRERLAKLAKHRLDQNEIQISEYIQAEMDYTEERGLLYKALSEFFVSKAKLNKAIGIKDYLPVQALHVESRT